MNSFKGKFDAPSFLRFLTSSSPRIDPSPFFAARVSAVAFASTTRFENVLLALSRRLLPLLLSVAVMICFLSYYASRPPQEATEYTEILIGNESAVAPPDSVEEVLASIGPLTPPGGNGED